jgi:hypothetical protein
MSMRGHTVRENVIIAYRGVNYELGQWPHGYGIWAVSSQEPLPVEWWEPTPDGWTAAWYRFTALEQPGSVSPVTQPAATPAATAPTQPAATQPGAAQPAATQPAAAQAATAQPAATQPAAAGAPGQAAFGAADTTLAGQPSGVHAAAAWTAPAGAQYQSQPQAAGPWSPAHPAAADATADVLLSTRAARIAAGLLGLGVILGVAGLFPAYLTGSSLASDAANLWEHLFYLVGWAISAVLIFRAGRYQRVGSLVAAGLSVVTFGFFLADAGYPISGGSSTAGAGLVLSIVGWLACAAGSAVAFGRWPAGWPRRPAPAEAGVVALSIAAAIGVAVTFAAPWDKLTLPTATGVSLSETLGNAFSNPGVVIAGNVLVMIGIVAAVTIAAFWRPARMGWALIGGVLIAVAAQIASALVQLSQVTTAGQLGLSSAQAAQLGISTSEHAQTSLTLAFWLYCLFALILFSACAWLALGREPSPVAAPQYGYGSPAGFGSPNPPVLAGTWPAVPPGYGPPAGPAGGNQAGGNQAGYPGQGRTDTSGPPAG